MPSYVGKARGTTVRLSNGATTLVYAGVPVPDGADAEDVKRLVAEGYLVATSAEEPKAAGPPARNASTEAWAAYALTLGATEQDLAGQSRDYIRDLVDLHAAAGK